MSGPSVIRRQTRPKSADVGGLHLATASESQGHGWVGSSSALQTQFAELLSDMYNETLNTVSESSHDFTVSADLSPDVRRRLICSLNSWSFEPHKLPPEEVLACTMLLFEGLFRIDGMKEAVGVSLQQMGPFIHHLRQIYRYENSYHNFEHALDVLQASYSFLRSAGMVPSLAILLYNGRMWRSRRPYDSGPLVTSLGLCDLFLVCIAAIGHDVGHPGFTNLFMKNAQTPLSVVFNDHSALEQMHCSLLLRMMQHHGLGAVLERPRARRLLWETVMATDMSVHAAFMERFSRTVAGEAASITQRKTLMCQAIMKCSDISNPSRPYHVSQHWATALMAEWTSQAQYEKSLALPCTVQSSETPLSEANSQVFFIKTFARPLLELVAKAVPEMQMYAAQCTSNLHTWEMRKADLERQPMPAKVTKKIDEYNDYNNAFPLTLPLTHNPEWSECLSSESDDTESLASSTLFSQGTTYSTELSVRSGQGCAAIRAAAGKAVRKQKSVGNRNSWSPVGMRAPGGDVVATFVVGRRTKFGDV
ncbi:HD-domain/PDEase-like protein [Armillaria solidipes]|uniref:Phosphodiesterase n=1 Tax=Armillaria solidipes TaxID=1076256 RepID=A0A2H3B987_9AGAR|nr:HD-domain/PDEase-like protein [Armillaria solidipes]